MTTQTEQTTTPQQQGSHHFVITLQKSTGGSGFFITTLTSTITPGPGATRHDVYQWLRRDIESKHPELADANVIFFSLELNQL